MAVISLFILGFVWISFRSRQVAGPKKEPSRGPSGDYPPPMGDPLKHNSTSADHLRSQFLRSRSPTSPTPPTSEITRVEYRPGLNMTRAGDAGSPKMVTASPASELTLTTLRSAERPYSPRPE
ncbi:hypothetical protein B0T16DRAFT_147311 [Cercophora newfieldiana]|uniref:Uncharacterized protein n=1 Tax=Cercophora newfieldiana TaxID=92897 RepID=A0AA39Y4D7_9PEZI|nr:hypothetical protein B0T16DRAFT_147311 [Cercophora newfieldiana]